MTSPTFHSGWSMQPVNEDRLDAMVDAAGGWGNVVMSRKHDGFRVLARVQDGRVDYFSRNGLVLPLHDFTPALLAMAEHLGRFLPIPTLYFDCECCGVTFEEALSGKHGNAPLSLRIFDLPVDDTTTLRGRRYWLEIAAMSIPTRSSVSVMQHVPAKSRENVFRLFARSREWGWEGLVLKDATAPYRAGESPAWVRLVHTMTHDLPVIRVEEGRGRARGSVGSFICGYRGREIGVLPGHASMAQRREMLTTPPSVIEVISRGETRDGALRHAAFVRERGDKAVVGHDATA